MRRARYRLKLWRAHEKELLPQLRAKAVSLSKRTGSTRADLLQEGILAAWMLPAREVEASPEPLTLQLEVAGAAMSALLDREFWTAFVARAKADDVGGIP